MSAIRVPTSSTEGVTCASASGSKRSCFQSFFSMAHERPADAAVASRLLSYPGAESWDRFAELMRAQAGEVAHANGETLFGAGRWDAARPWFERAVAAKAKGDAWGRVDHGSLGWSMARVGWCFGNAGRFDEARSWFERAVEVQAKGDSDGRVDYCRLAGSLNNVGAYLGAMIRLGRCLDLLDPGNFAAVRAAHARLSAAFMATGLGGRETQGARGKGPVYGVPVHRGDQQPGA